MQKKQTNNNNNNNNNKNKTKEKNKKSTQGFISRDLGYNPQILTSSFENAKYYC